MRSKTRTPFKISVAAPSTGLNTRLPKIGPGALANYGAYGASAANLGSVDSLRDATAASNMRFEDGVACNAPGYVPVSITPTPDGPINLIAQANLSSQLATISTRSPIIGTSKSLYAASTDSGYLRVFAGTDQVIYDASIATLSATFTDTFGNGSNTPAFTWTKLSGPTATIDSPNAQTTFVERLAPGVYVFQVSATDSGTTVTAQVKVTVIFGKTAAYVETLFGNAVSACACPLNGFIYVSDTSIEGLQIYNPSTNTIVGSVTGFPIVAGQNQIGPAYYNPTDGFLYVLIVSPGSGPSYSAYVSRVDPNANIVVSSVAFPGTVDNNTIGVIGGNYLVMLAEQQISSPEFGIIALNLTTMTMGSWVQFASFPFCGFGLCYNPSDGLFYSACGYNSDIGLVSFNAATNAVVQYYDTGQALSAFQIDSVAYCSQDNSFYIAMNGATPYGLWRYNIAANSMTNVSGGVKPTSVLYEPTNRRLYFLLWNFSASAQLCYYDPAGKTFKETGIVLTFYNNAPFPGYLAYSKLFNSLYLASFVFLQAMTAP